MSTTRDNPQIEDIIGRLQLLGLRPALPAGLLAKRLPRLAEMVTSLRSFRASDCLFTFDPGEIEEFNGILSSVPVWLLSSPAAKERTVRAIAGATSFEVWNDYYPSLWEYRTWMSPAGNGHCVAIDSLAVNDALHDAWKVGVVLLVVVSRVAVSATALIVDDDLVTYLQVMEGYTFANYRPYRTHSKQVLQCSARLAESGMDLLERAKTAVGRLTYVVPDPHPADDSDEAEMATPAESPPPILRGGCRHLPSALVGLLAEITTYAAELPHDVRKEYLVIGVPDELWRELAASAATAQWVMGMHRAQPVRVELHVSTKASHVFVEFDMQRIFALKHWRCGNSLHTIPIVLEHNRNGRLLMLMPEPLEKVVLDLSDEGMASVGETGGYPNPQFVNEAQWRGKTLYVAAARVQTEEV